MVRAILEQNCEEIATAFSPDGDGVNDTWIIPGIETLPDNKVTIFSRWGDVIEEYSGYDNSTIVWDGKNSNGDDLPNGTYFYVIEIFGSGQSRNGWIQITK